MHGTNPDWRCFQQNYRGVVFCAEMKVLQMSWNFLMIFLEHKRPPKHRGRTIRWSSRAQDTGARLRGRACPVDCVHLEAHPSVKPMPKNPINRETIRNNPRSEVPPPQASVSTKNQSRLHSGTLPEGEIITGGHLHHPGSHHDEEGVVHPRGWGFVLVAMCLISLSLSCSWDGTILMYHRLC